MTKPRFTHHDLDRIQAEQQREQQQQQACARADSALHFSTLISVAILTCIVPAIFKGVI